MNGRKVFSSLGAILLCALLPGCGGSRAEFFRLSAEAAASRRASFGASVGVGPVSLPNYIDRAELVFQSGPNEFQIPPNVSWAGSLRENLTNVLARDLQQILGVREVAVAPFAGDRLPSYRVALDVRQFHGISGSDVIFDVTWRVQNRGGEIVREQSATFRQPIEGDGYAAVVSAESRALAQCADAIALSLP